MSWSAESTGDHAARARAHAPLGALVAAPVAAASVVTGSAGKPLGALDGALAIGVMTRTQARADTRRGRGRARGGRPRYPTSTAAAPRRATQKLAAAREDAAEAEAVALVQAAEAEEAAAAAAAAQEDAMRAKVAVTLAIAQRNADEEEAARERERAADAAQQDAEWAAYAATARAQTAALDEARALSALVEAAREREQAAYAARQDALAASAEPAPFDWRAYAGLREGETLDAARAQVARRLAREEAERAAAADAAKRSVIMLGRYSVVYMNFDTMSRVAAAGSIRAESRTLREMAPPPPPPGFGYERPLLRIVFYLVRADQEVMTFATSFIISNSAELATVSGMTPRAAIEYIKAYNGAMVAKTKETRSTNVVWWQKSANERESMVKEDAVAVLAHLEPSNCVLTVTYNLVDAY